MTHDLIVIALGWAIPAILAWLIAQVNPVKVWAQKHQYFAIGMVCWLVSILTSFTAIYLYDLFVVPPGAVVLMGENAGTDCPRGYKNENTMIFGRWHTLDDRLQTLKDPVGNFPGIGNDDWKLEHATLCLKDADRIPRH